MNNIPDLLTSQSSAGKPWHSGGCQYTHTPPHCAETDPKYVSSASLITLKRFPLESQNECFFLTSEDDSPAFKELRRCDIEKQSQNINLITCHNDFRTIFSRNTHILGYRNDDQQVKNNLFNHYFMPPVMSCYLTKHRYALKLSQVEFDVSNTFGVTVTEEVINI